MRKEKKRKKENTGASNCDGLTATKFKEFFTIAKTLCGNFTSNSTMPKILTPRVIEAFVLQNVSTSLVQRDLSKLKPGKATGPDGISAKLLKDASPEIARPIANLQVRYKKRRK